MIKICDKNKCTGCSACFNICPKNAVTMVEDEEGFLFPKINEELCINCGLCQKICINRLDQKQKSEIFPKVHALKAKDINLQRKSSSGGAFSVFANYVLEENGIIYGASFNEDLLCQHIRVERKEDLDKLRGSKYVQSNIGNCLNLLKIDLLINKLVLFVGTPCQVAGLKSFLQKEYDNLICIDILCHGVPSQKIFNDYISWLQKRQKNKIVSYEFRNKDKRDWSICYRSKYKTQNKTKYITSFNDVYLKKFLDGSILRESCYNCDFASKNRCGDITIGDYWGVQKEHKEFFDYNGVSVVLINNLKGKQIFGKIKNNTEFLESTFEKVSKYNHNLIMPSIRPQIRNEVYKKDIGFLYQETKKISLFQKIKNLVPYKIKKLLKK